MPNEATRDVAAAVRRFNRFYTRQLGLLNEKLLDSTFTLTEARVLYELAQAATPVMPSQLCRDLVLDAGYLSRIIKAFEARGLLSREPSETDGRQNLVILTDAGRRAFAPLDQASAREIGQRVAPMPAADRAALVGAMGTIEQLLVADGTRPAEEDRRPPVRENTALPVREPTQPVSNESTQLPAEENTQRAGGSERLSARKGDLKPIGFRDMRPGDLGWIAHRQTRLYQQDYGWDDSYEVLAAEILVGFVRNFDPEWEKSWIAVRGDAVVGSVFVVRASDSVAKLRLLYVEPEARGLGLGQRLVEACIRFARQRGYRTLTLWTNDVLVPARRIYQAAGFRCVEREPHRAFGQDLVSETWSLSLTDKPENQSRTDA